MVCFISEAIDLLYIQNNRPALGTSGLLFNECCVSSPALKQFMHEADHLSLISAEVTDQCSCNCDSVELHYGVHTDNFTFYHSCVGMAPISISTQFSATENEENVES